MNKVTELLAQIIKDADTLVLFKGRKTFALSDPQCPVDTAGQYVINELHKIMPPAKKKEAPAS